MPLEGHGMDCDCGCCDVEEASAPEVKPRGEVCMCPTCGTDTPSAGGISCADMKCPSCGAAMKVKK